MLRLRIYYERCTPYVRSTYIHIKLQSTAEQLNELWCGGGGILSVPAIMLIQDSVASTSDKNMKYITAQQCVVLTHFILKRIIQY